jgi:hypothetical protein
MKRMGVVGVCVVAALAMSVVTAASAVAAPPDFGKCEVKAGGGLAKNCAKNFKVGESKEYGWNSSAATGDTFTTTRDVTSVPTLETTSLRKLTCTAEEGAGEISGAKTVRNVTMNFNGCEMGGVPCQNGPPGEISTTKLDGELGVEKTVAGEEGKKNKIGEDLKPESGTVLEEFQCAGLKGVVRGSVISPVKTNSMLTSEAHKFNESKGKQKPEKFEGLPKDTLESSSAGGPFEQTGWAMILSEQFRGAVEVNSVH